MLARLPDMPDPTARAAVLDALGWSSRRPAQIVQIRPDDALPGDGFSGFASRDQRQQYVDTGVRAAQSAVAALAQAG